MNSLTFRLGAIPVRVHVSFLVVSAMLGASGRVTLAGLVQWVLVVFVGVLLHELGHAYMGMAFGLVPQIDLQGMGGLTSWTAGTRSRISAGQRIAISVAGPMVGVVIGGATGVWWKLQPHVSPQLESLLWAVVLVNLGWGILNLMPILPMDGGNVLYTVLQQVTKGRGEIPARAVSAVLATALGLFFLVQYHSFLWALYPFGMFAIINVRALQAQRAPQAAPPPDARF